MSELANEANHRHAGSLDFSSTLDRTREALLGELATDGHWVGELSSSALSTATAIIALNGFLNSQVDYVDESQLLELTGLICIAKRWLLNTQNDDGGWGDTIHSESNISTTSLAWGALADRNDEVNDATAFAQAEQRCEDWLRRAAGSLEPRRLAGVIKKRYGRDSTFSVPILTALAITGRLGSSADAWSLIVQLPFEIAALPHRWFALAKLPVVSYALPALIAMGHARHRRCPTKNPVTRLVRKLAWKRTKQKLIEIQPRTGGFLEATPLTSFVIMALLAADAEPKIVIQRGVDFLIRSMRPDGSWPIDTNLATWITTLSVNAFASGGSSDWRNRLPVEAIRNWLAQQQYDQLHPYTHAGPGGWAWTDLEGGVPDADDTSGALLALRHLAGGDDLTAAKAGLRWLTDLQNRDGGVPTFCRGWGTLPFDRSSNDITAHAIRAWVAWRDDVDIETHRLISVAIDRAVRYLHQHQRSDGAWAPLWFGNQAASPEENLMYGTSRVLLACADLISHNTSENGLGKGYSAIHGWRRALGWIVNSQNDDGGWGSEASIASSIEETALAVEALARMLDSTVSLLADEEDGVGSARVQIAIDRGAQYLVLATAGGANFPPAPIGFYFAKLWYFERLYPMIWTLAALERVCGRQCPSETL